MIRSFIFSQGKLVQQDSALDFMKVMLADEGVHMWVDISQYSADEAKSVLEGVFAFHPLSIEDCLTPSELPKIDEYENYVFMVIHGMDYSQATHEFRTNELNIFIGKNFLVTVHENPLRSVASTIDRVLKNAAAVARAPDRLTYTLLDFLLENYGPPMDDLASEYAELETSMLTTSTKDFMSRVLQLKGELQKLRQIVRPQRDVVARLARGEFKIVRAHMLPYYRDLLDQLVRMTDFAENYRDALNHTLEVYAAVQQMEINRVVKVLTVLGALAIPVLVITSFYGMNVKHMPNTEWPEWYWAYAWIFGVTALSTGAMYWFMRRRGW